MQERPYQAAAHAAIRSELQKGVYHQLLVMATGTGKTVVFSKLPEKLGDLLPGQQMILAHREELIDQAVAKMRLLNPKLRIDKEMASHHADAYLADVVVASVATLGRAGSKRLDKFNWSNFDKFVTDEAHHSTAQGYQTIYEAAGLMREGDKRLLLGVTATPNRPDGTPLAQVYSKIVYSYDLRQAVKDGYLVEPYGIRVKTNTTLEGIKSSGGDFAQAALADRVNTPERNQTIVKAWLDQSRKHPHTLRTIGFTADIQHARDLAAMFQHSKILAEPLWGDDPEREDKIARHQAGEFPVLLNCAVLTEGYDDPPVECVILARPTKSGILFAQCVGRGTRLFTGKSRCLVIDVVDSSAKNSLVTLPTLMGLPAGMDLKGKGVVWAAEKLEEAQKEYPYIDFSTLPDIDAIEQYVEEVNLFDVKFPPEVETNSTLSWYPGPTGGYVLLLPSGEQVGYRTEKDRVELSQNLLDKWEIRAIIKGKKYRGERSSLEEVFSAADSLIQATSPEALKILRRTEVWHDEPATPGQLTLLKKLMKGKVIPPDIDKGTASKVIGACLAGKK